MPFLKIDMRHWGPPHQGPQTWESHKLEPGEIRLEQPHVLSTGGGGGGRGVKSSWRVFIERPGLKIDPQTLLGLGGGGWGWGGVQRGQGSKTSASFWHISAEI